MKGLQMSEMPPEIEVAFEFESGWLEVRLATLYRHRWVFHLCVRG